MDEASAPVAVLLEEPLEVADELSEELALLSRAPKVPPTTVSSEGDEEVVSAAADLYASIVFCSLRGRALAFRTGEAKSR